jgi:hypothetical protein
MPDVRRLKQQLVPSNTDVGDGTFTFSMIDFVILT